MPFEGLSSALLLRHPRGRTVLSQLPLASVFPSGLNATLLTLLVCPLKTLFSFLVDASNRRMVLLLDFANTILSALKRYPIRTIGTDIGLFLVCACGNIPQIGFMDT